MRPDSPRSLRGCWRFYRGSFLRFLFDVRSPTWVYGRCLRCINKRCKYCGGWCTLQGKR